MKGTHDKKWYALTTKFKSEVIAEQELLNKGIETYLPKEKKLIIFSDKRKWIEAPLISNYIFVRVTEKEKELVKFTRGVGGFLTFANEVPIIPDTQILSLQIMLDENINYVKTNETFYVGEQVKIIRKDLLGLEGKLVKYKGKNKVLLELNSLHAGFIIDVPVKYLQKAA